MPYPPGVQTSTLTFSNPITFLGNEALRTEVTVQPTAGVVWTATGQPIDDFAEVVAPGEGMPGSLTAPYVDQAGFTDQAGNSFTMWAYIVTRKTFFGSSMKSVKKVWAPILGQATMDFDNLPGGSVGLPVSAPAVPVTSVAGLAGVVPADDLATELAPFLPDGVTPESVAANLPARLEEPALSATIDTQGAASVGNGLSAWWTALLTWLKSLFIPAVVIFPTSNVADKLAEAATAGLDAVFTPGTYTVPAGGWTWEATRHSLLAAGNVIFDATGLTSGPAITVRGNDGRDYLIHDFMQTTHRMQGIRLNLPTSDATTVDGILIQDVGTGSRGNSHVNLENVIITHGRDQVFLGDNTWCVRFVNIFFNKAHRYGVHCDSGLNAGENYTFIGSTLAGAHNAAGTAIAFYTAPTGNVDGYFHGTSFDYNDCSISHNSGVMSLFGAHIEGNNSLGPEVKLSYTPSLSRTSFNMFGGVLAPTELNASRVSLIDCISGSAIFVGLHSVAVGVWEKELDVVRVLADTPTVRILGGDIQTGGTGLQSFPGKAQQRLYNPDFEAGTLAGWAQGGIVTYTAQSTTKNSGTYAVKMNSVGTAGSSFFSQTLDCRPQDHVFVGAHIASDTMTAGDVVLTIRFYAADGTTIISSQTVATVNANQAFTKYRNRYTAPAGTRTVQFRFVPTNLNGNVYADDCYLAIN